MLRALVERRVAPPAPHYARLGAVEGVHSFGVELAARLPAHVPVAEGLVDAGEGRRAGLYQFGTREAPGERWPVQAVIVRPGTAALRAEDPGDISVPSISNR